MNKRIFLSGCAVSSLLAISLMAQPEPATKPATAPAATAATVPANGAAADGNTRTLPDGLSIITVQASDGGAKAGDIIWVHYTGTLKDGTKFDSSRDPGKDPIQIVLGKGQVIKGWDEGLVGMKVGEKRQLIIPSDLAYGDAGRPGIPPKSELHFDVELVGLARVGD